MSPVLTSTSVEPHIEATAIAEEVPQQTEPHPTSVHIGVDEDPVVGQGEDTNLGALALSFGLPEEQRTSTPNPQDEENPPSVSLTALEAALQTADSSRTQLSELQSAIQTGYNSPLVSFLQPEEDAVSSVYDVPSLPCGDNRNLQHHQSEGGKRATT